MPLRPLTPSELERLDDHIFRRDILGGMKWLSEVFGLDLRLAIDQFSGRYAVLRKTCADRFTMTDAEYWEGYSS